MPIEKRAGLKINSLTLGKGDDQALLLHCSLANSRAWLPLAEEFKNILSMIAFDLPGHGMSQDWDYKSDYQDEIECYWAKHCQYNGVMTSEPWDHIKKEDSPFTYHNQDKVFEICQKLDKEYKEYLEEV